MKSEFYISNDDWMKIQHYAKARHGQIVNKRQLGHEIGGMMIAQLDKSGDWILSNPAIIKQVTSAGTCTMDKEALADYYIEMAQKHGKDIQFVWWHSHGNMSAFWSGTDKATMKEYASGSWSMFLVVNIKGECQFRVQMWDPIIVGEEVDLNIMDAPGQAIPKAILTEVEAKCSEEHLSGWQRNGHTTYNNSRQMTLYGDTRANKAEIRDYNQSFNVQDDEDLAIKYLIDKLDNLNTKWCAGEIKHKDYRKAVERLNAKMEKNRFDYCIMLPNNDDELDQLIQVSFAWDMIVDKITGLPADLDDGCGALYYV